MEKIKRSLAFPKRQPNNSIEGKLSYTPHVTNSQCALPISDFSVKKVVRHLMEAYQVRCQEIAVHFVSRPKIQALHKRFFQDGTATDCITLPYSSPEEASHCLGEIFICPEVALTYAKRHGLDPYKELTLYLVHGFLHLMGFKDKTAAQRQQMRAEERKCLEHVPSLR